MLIFDRGAKGNTMNNRESATNGAGTAGYPRAEKKESRHKSYTLYKN